MTLSPEPLPADIHAELTRHAGRLGTCAGRVRYWAVVTSTNDVAAGLADQGAADGTAVVADMQTAGRGRHGRSWHSPRGGGLYLSIVLDAADATHLTLMAGVAVAEAIRRATGLAVEIKWPNDIVSAAGGRWRKLAGILAEATRAGSTADRTVLGIGINLRPVDRPAELAAGATSLEEELSRPIDRALVLVECLASLASWRAALAGGGREAVLARWRELSPSCRGARVVWTADHECRGTTAGIDEHGALLVRLEEGHVERLVGGGVTWL